MGVQASVGWLVEFWPSAINTYPPAIATTYALAKCRHWFSRASCVGLCVANRLFLALATLYDVANIKPCGQWYQRWCSGLTVHFLLLEFILAGVWRLTHAGQIILVYEERLLWDQQASAAATAALICIY